MRSDDQATARKHEVRARAQARQRAPGSRRRGRVPEPRHGTAGVRRPMTHAWTVCSCGSPSSPSASRSSSLASPDAS